MKKHFIFITMSFFLVWNLVNFAAEAQEIDFYDLMHRVANSVKENALFSELNTPEKQKLSTLNTTSFKTTLLPPLMAAYEKSRMASRVIWLNIVRDIRKYDRTEIEKNRPNRWHLGNLVDLTLGLENSTINDTWMKGLREAYRDSFYDD